MRRYILDTDHISLAQRGHAQVLSQVLSMSSESLSISIVSVQELMRGRLAQTQRAKNNTSLIRAYKLLHEAITFYRALSIIDFDEHAATVFDDLRQQKIRIGTLDLRIAAIALAHNRVLVTRNARDFERVPNLWIEDWSASL